jgi:hypothetical protein
MELGFTIGAEVEILVSKHTADPRLPSPVVVMSVIKGINNGSYGFIRSDV